MSADATTPIGLVGLGLVGRALARRLQAAGHRLLGFDRASSACTAWDGEIAASARAVAERCACVVLAVYDSAGVLEVVEGEHGLLGGAGLRVVIDCSTGDPDALQALAGRLAAQGIDFIEAPLSGSSHQIERGEATMLLGAEPAALQRHASLLDALSARRVVVGGAGMGARAKLATNLVLGLNRAALAEGIVFAERLGIPPAAFVELVLATPARSAAALVKGAMMASGEFGTPQARIHQHLKDVQLMLAQAADAHQRLPLSEVHAALLREAVAAGDGELDNAAVIRQIRRAII